MLIEMWARILGLYKIVHCVHQSVPSRVTIASATLHSIAQRYSANIAGNPYQ